jgi:2-methylcitrate dehydratase PrpD
MNENTQGKVTGCLASFVRNLEYQKLPEEVISQAKKCLLDFIGISMPGHFFSWGKTFYRLLETVEPREAILIGIGGRRSARTAAFFNGCMTNILDSVDGSKFGGCHGGATVTPAALSLAEKLKASSRELITAIVAGYEIMIRAAASVHPSHTIRGHNPDGICGALGAAAAASKLLNLNTKGVMDSLSSALYLAPLSLVGDIRIGRFLNRPTVKGQAASVGILAAMLAKNGVQSSRNVFEGAQGFCMAESDESKLETITQNLGKNFKIMEIYFKPYPGERHSHSAIGCALQIKMKYNIRPEEIAKICVRTYDIGIKLMHHYPEPGSSIPQHTASLPFLVAAAFQNDKFGPRSFFEKVLNDKKVHELAGRVECILDNEINNQYPEKTPAIVEVITKAGKRHRKRMDYPLGDAYNPMKYEDLQRKFYEYASIVISDNQIETILATLSNLEHLKDVRELTKLLYAHAKKS